MADRIQIFKENLWSGEGGGVLHRGFMIRSCRGERRFTNILSTSEDCKSEYFPELWNINEEKVVASA